ncbi:twin-arginine translocase TatA/TatE family subunit [Actinomadura craniellae]|uniref:Sec-independent protein translocase protein TatA n=1 Tax=Actinomadura craniellae TaxID=2231787 RepID=A0A365HD70_9ACTN|nr:twin-arginine translocase TatA/TatE family subunit [Actinomadura craniellae]RAY16962.1 twin-arginine translocase TatA/TatE family subunit [Actinomadura craniellae]
MANFGTTEILIVLFVLLLLFGSTKLPQLARSLGKSARILKAETKGLYDDDEPAADRPEAAARPRHGNAAHPNALQPGRPLESLPLSDPARLRER